MNPVARATRLREGIVGFTALLLLGASFYFFINSLDFMTQQPPRVAASLLSAMLGLATLASSVTLFRAWLLSRAFEGERREERSPEAQ